MLSRLLRGFWLFTCLALAQERQPGDRVNLFSIEREIALGKQQAAEFRRHTTRLDNAEVRRYVDDLGQRLAERIGGPPFTYTFTVIEDDPSPLHEPVALPGGFLFVPARLILAARDEAELAGMLAHAMAHVAARDETRTASRAQMMNLSAARLPSTALLQAKRRMELDADRLAAAKIAQAGYDPAALSRYIEREQPSYDEASQALFAPLPRTAQRVEAIREVVAGLPPREYGPHHGLAAIRQAVRKALKVEKAARAVA